MTNEERIAMDKKPNSGWLYQIGLPVARLVQAFMMWDAYDRPCKIVVNRAQKNDNWAVLELRHDMVAAEIVDLVHESQVNIVKDQPEKMVVI